MMQQMFYVECFMSRRGKGTQVKVAPWAHGPHVRVGSEAGAEHKAVSIGVAAGVLGT
jgi:hypothetical protein